MLRVHDENPVVRMVTGITAYMGAGVFATKAAKIQRALLQAKSDPKKMETLEEVCWCAFYHSRHTAAFDPEPHERAARLFWYDQMRVKDIAKTMGISASWVSNMISTVAFDMWGGLVAYVE